MSERTSFSVLPRIISHFGEDLIKNESVALLELVKNSYDACAKECKVMFKTNSENKLIKIIIEDDGFGMHKDIILNSWLVIGTDFKDSNKGPNQCGRVPLGEKGIGRLGVHKLGNKIKLISKSLNKREVELNIDWNLLNKAKALNDFKVIVSENEEPQYFKKGATGTRIIVDDIKGIWDGRTLREVYRNLISLNSPFSKKNDSFKVYIESDSNIFEGLPNFDEIMEAALYFGKCKMSGDRITEFKYEFKPWLGLTKINKGRAYAIKDMKKEDLTIKGEKKDEIINLDKMHIGDIVFDLCIFETDSQIFGYSSVEKKSIRDYLRENGGVRVYRDDMRVYDYGERSNDWLGVDLRRVHRVGGNVSNNIILGSVKIDGINSCGLKEKTNREGFIENDSYIAFREAVDYALSLIVRERNIDKKRLTDIYKKHKIIEPVLSDLNELTLLVKKKLPENDDRKDILKYINRINEQYKNTKEILIKSANAGLNLSAVVHEIEKQTSILIDSINKRKIDSIKQIALRIENIIKRYGAMVRKSAMGVFPLSDIVKISIESYQFRFDDHNIEVFSNYKGNKLKAYFSKPEAISSIGNLLDNSIYWLNYAEKNNRKIAVYITDEIEGYNSVIISDNGPGFNIPFDIALQPFITGKPHNIGMGLGLHVVNEMMYAMKGKLLFLHKNTIECPKYVEYNKINSAILALCFKVENK